MTYLTRIFLIYGRNNVFNEPDILLNISFNFLESLFSTRFHYDVVIDLVYLFMYFMTLRELNRK